MLTITVTDQDIDAIARTSMSEVGHFGQYGPAILKGGVEAVVDTILNRVAHPGYPDGIDEVVNQRAQFSAIGGPGGVKTWKRLGRASDPVADIVADHLAARAEGADSTVQGATHFLNPNFSSASALRTWGNHVVRHAIAVWGHKRDIHFHGFAPGAVSPPAYRIVRPGLDLAAVAGGGGGTVTIVGGGITTGPTITPVVPPPAGGGGITGTTRPATNDDAAAANVGTIAGDDDDGGGMTAYHVEEAPPEAGALSTALNRLSAEGWHLRHILPAAGKLLLVMEGSDTDDLVHECDDRADEPGFRAVPPPVGKPVVITDATPEGRFAKFLTGVATLAHFDPGEFLVLGAQNASGPAKGLNTLPPEELWDNIVATAKVLDVVRERLGAAIRVSSAYRSPAYNAKIPGAAGGSVHMQFRACDFTCADGRGSVFWGRQLKALRDDDLFKGGIGIYPTFVHVDTRGENRKFGPWMNRVFG